MRTYISRQKAQSFGVFTYRQAKQGKLMLVSAFGQTWWLGYVIPHGFYITPCE